MIKFTETSATVVNVSFLPSSERPAIVTRLEAEDKDVGTISHMVRLNNPKSARIPDWMNSEPHSPNSLRLHQRRKKPSNASSPNPKTLRASRSASPMSLALEGGRPKKGDNGEILYNIRLRSNTHDLDDATADALIASLNLSAQADLEKMAREANAAV